jgi:exosortase A-associated hydrolase 2
MHNIVEDMFFFPGGSGVQLLGFLSKPIDTPILTGIIFCHPFAEEKNCSHAVVAKAAREFAAQGHAVLRFDFSGCGDSEGDMIDFRLHNWLDDIRAAISEMQQRTQIDKVVLWGLRLGAALAGTYARQNTDISGMILWQPIYNYQDYMKQFLRGKQASSISNQYGQISIKSLLQDIESGNAVEVHGYPVADPLYSSFAQLDGLNQAEIVCPTFISTISKMTLPPTMTIRKAERMLSKDSESFYTHIIAEPFWDRYWQWEAPQAVNSTKEWLGKLGWVSG